MPKQSRSRQKQSRSSRSRSRAGAEQEQSRSRSGGRGREGGTHPKASHVVVHLHLHCLGRLCAHVHGKVGDGEALRVDLRGAPSEEHAGQAGGHVSRLAPLGLGEADALVQAAVGDHLCGEGDAEDAAVHAGRQLHSDAPGGHGGVEEVRLDDCRARLPGVLNVAVQVAHLGREQKPAPVPDPRRRLVRAAHKREAVLAAVEPPRARVPAALGRLRRPVVEAPGVAHQRQRVARRKHIAVGKGAGQQVGKVFGITNRPHRGLGQQRQQRQNNRSAYHLDPCRTEQPGPVRQRIDECRDKSWRLGGSAARRLGGSAAFGSRRAPVRLAAVIGDSAGDGRSGV